MNNPPAFPTLVHDDDRNVSVGMTLRDYFAAAAMQGLVSNPHFEGDAYLILAASAFAAADAMLKAREQ